MDKVNFSIVAILGCLLTLEYIQMKNWTNKEAFWGKSPQGFVNWSSFCIVVSLLAGLYSMVFYIPFQLPKKEDYTKNRENIQIGLTLFIGGALLWPYSLCQGVSDWVKILSLIITCIGVCYVFARELQITLTTLDGFDIANIVCMCILIFQTTINDLILWTHFSKISKK